MRENILFCFVAPAGSGKSTVCQQLVNLNSDLALSVSTTSRPPRPGEVNGKEYFFVNKQEFESRIKQGDFIEHAIFGGNHYGTEKKNVEQIFSKGFDLLLDIEVQGVIQLKKIYGARVVTIFIFPPGFKILRDRLFSRGTEDKKSLEIRLSTAAKEVEILSQPNFSDYLLINDQLDRTIQLANSIIHAERLRFARFSSLYITSLINS